MGVLTVVRHGQASMLSADYDKLSELGHDQARQLGQWWLQQGVAFDDVYSGPAKRHLGTARGVCEAWPRDDAPAEPQVLPGLDEHDAFGMVMKVVPQLSDDPKIVALHQALGEATSRKDRSAGFQRLFEAIMVRWLAGDFAHDDVETWPAFQQRVDAAVDRMLQQSADRGGRIVAFSSVGPIAVMLRRALKTSDLRSFETAWRLRNASVTTFVFGRGRFTLDSFNVVHHLSNPNHHTFR
jgi:broad specificity phosphatase PhoE